MPIVKHKVPSADQINAKQEFEILNSNIEILSGALDQVKATLENNSQRDGSDERLRSLSMRISGLEKSIEELKESQVPKPKKITMQVTGRNDVTGQIDQVELHID